MPLRKNEAQSVGWPVDAPSGGHPQISAHILSQAIFYRWPSLNLSHSGTAVLEQRPKTSPRFIFHLPRSHSASCSKQIILSPSLLCGSNPPLINIDTRLFVVFLFFLEPLQLFIFFVLSQHQTSACYGSLYKEKQPNMRTIFRNKCTNHRVY